MTIEEMKQKKLALGYSNEEIARLSGVPLGTIMKIFSGVTKAPRRATILALEKVFAPVEASFVREAPPAYDTEAVSFSDEKKYTLDDYYALPDERRVELIDGVFYDMASPSSNHQILIGELYLQLKLCERAHKGSCRVLLSPLDVQLDQDRYTMLQPDLIIVCDAGRIHKRLIFGAPDLAIEILSPSSRSRDLVLKLRKYKAAGVREYWVVDPEYRQVFVYLFGEETILHMYSFDDKVPVFISEGECVIDFEEISSMLV